MSNNCTNSESTTFAYLDGELEELDVRDFESHLSGCTSCQEELDSAMSEHSALRMHLQSPPAAPEGLEARMMIALDSEEFEQRKQRRQQRRQQWLSWSLPTGASVLAAAALVLFMWSDLQSSDTAQPQSSQVTRDTARQHFQDTPLFVSGDPSTVGRGAGQYLNRSVAPPQFSTQQKVRLLGWTPSSVNGKQSATIVYEVVNRTGRHEMRVNLVPRQSLDLLSQRKLTLAGSSYWVDSAYGVQTVTVDAGESIAYVFSSDLSIEVLLSLVTQTDIVNTLRPGNSPR